jgi:hypothetical protein
LDSPRDGLRGRYRGITDDAIVDVVRFHLDPGISVAKQVVITGPTE